MGDGALSPADTESRAVSQIRVRAILFLVLAIAAGGGAVVLFKQYLDRIRGADRGERLLGAGLVLVGVALSVHRPPPEPAATP